MPNWDGRLGLVAFGMGMAILNDQYSAQPREMQVLTQSPLGTAAIRVEFFMGAMLLGILLTNLFGYDPQRMSRLVGVGCVPVSAATAATPSGSSAPPSARTEGVRKEGLLLLLQRWSRSRSSPPVGRLGAWCEGGARLCDHCRHSF